jgi:hypothetical protein
MPRHGERAGDAALRLRSPNGSSGLDGATSPSDDLLCSGGDDGRDGDGGGGLHSGVSTQSGLSFCLSGQKQGNLLGLFLLLRDNDEEGSFKNLIGTTVVTRKYCSISK